MAGPASHGHAADHTPVSVALFDTAGSSGESGCGSMGNEGKPSESETCAAIRTHVVGLGAGW
jgi:hypothetical protein